MRDRLYHFFLDRGILLRPLGNVLYLLPPYCIEEEELKTIYDQIETVAQPAFETKFDDFLISRSSS